MNSATNFDTNQNNQNNQNNKIFILKNTLLVLSLVSVCILVLLLMLS
jgi:hypothetical protein